MVFNNPLDPEPAPAYPPSPHHDHKPGELITREEFEKLALRVLKLEQTRES